MISLGMPAGPTTDLSPSESKVKVIHPTFHFHHAKELSIPNEGHALIKFRKVRSTQDNTDPADPKFSHELEVHGIEMKESPQEDKPEAMPEAMLKAGMRKAMNKGNG